MAWLLPALLLMVSCIESNPQPSPGTPDGSGAMAEVTMVEDTMVEADTASAADTVASDGTEPPPSDVGADGGQDTGCVPHCDGKECGSDGCGGECCGGAPMEPGRVSCCGDLGGKTCSEWCDVWGGEPPTCIPTAECIQACIAECPDGWTCTFAPLSGVDIGFYCLPDPFGPACQPCKSDAECPGGGALWEPSRCAQVLSESPICVSECSGIPALPCRPGYSCVASEVLDGAVLDLCVPDPDQCICQPPKPYLLDGHCVECLTTADCDDEGLACNPANHRCEPADGACGYCEAPYPACVTINGIWSCVQCKYDEDCPEGVICNPTMHCCGCGGEQFCNGCTPEEGCLSISGEFQLECDGGTGCCYDVMGRCDGVEAFCPNGECKGLWDILGCGVWLAPDEGPCGTTDSGQGVCTCTTPLDMEALSACLPPDFCAGGSCSSEAICVDSSVLEFIYGNASPFDDGVCLSKNVIIQEL